MQKILTISIAAYNVEKYIRCALNSLLICEDLLNLLEIFVIDDGGSDSTLSIAKEYERKYPGIIYAVHKEDDGYGSTVNYSLKHASGKYFKLLDGDDWFDKNNLEKIVKLLIEYDHDVIVDDFYKFPEGRTPIYVKAHNYDDGSSFLLNKINPSVPIGMWALIYKTSVLRKVNLKLPENMFYVDQIYSTYPFSEVNSVLFLRMPLYCYRLGRDGQSVSRQSRIKNYRQMLSCCDMLLTFSREKKLEKNKNYNYILYRVTRYYQTALRTILLLQINTSNKKLLTDYENKSKEINLDVFYRASEVSKFGILIDLFRKSKYTLYWLLKLFPMPNWK